jgi:NADH:ubiquinone oxidoreductase subunit E
VNSLTLFWSANLLSEVEQQELNEILEKYPDKRSAVLPALYITQRRQNYLTDGDIRDVAQALELNVTEVQAIVGFYTLLRKEPTGKYLI